MNAFGKILVVLNLVVALLTLGFFVVTKSRPTNWVERSEELSAQLRVSRDVAASKDPALRELLQERRNYKNDLENEAKKVEVVKAEKQEQIEKLKADVAQLDIQANTADYNKKIAEEESKKKDVLVKALGDALKSSEKDKLDLQDAINKFRNQTAEYKEQSERLAKTNADLTDIIRRKNEEIVRRSAPSGIGPGNKIVRDPNAPNPPGVKVKGEITKVSRDAGDGAGLMVTVSVGADQGVRAEHTLDVYRLTPAPEYLGRLRILSSTERDSVGRLIQRGAANVNLKAGDIVVDQIGN